MVQVSVQGKFDNLGLQVEEEGEMTSWDSHDGGRLLGEKPPTIHHSWELLVAKIHGEAQGYHTNYGVGMEASLV
jgi:hypothetical protein